MPALERDINQWKTILEIKNNLSKTAVDFFGSDGAIATLLKEAQNKSDEMFALYDKKSFDMNIPYANSIAAWTALEGTMLGMNMLFV